MTSSMATTPKNLPARGATVAFEYDMVDRGRKFEERGKWTVTSGLLMVSLELGLGVLYLKSPCSEPLPYWLFGRFAGGVTLRGTIGGILWHRGRVLEDKQLVAKAVHEARAQGDSLAEHGIVVSRNFKSPFVRGLIMANIFWLIIGVYLIYKTGCMESAWAGSCTTCNDEFVEMMSLFVLVDIIYNCVSYPFFWSGNVAGDEARDDGDSFVGSPSPRSPRTTQAPQD